MQWPLFKKSRGAGDSNTSGACGDVQLLLSLHSDGMTSAAEGRRVEEHLEACESCRKAFFWMRATHDVLSHRPAVLPPGDMSGRILRAIAEADARERPPVRTRFNLRPAYAFAASLLIAAIAAISVNHARNAAVAPANESAAVSPSTINSGSAPVVTAPQPSSHVVAPAGHAAPAAPHRGVLVASQSGNHVMPQAAPARRSHSVVNRAVLMARLPTESFEHHAAVRFPRSAASVPSMARVEPVSHGIARIVLSPKPAQVARVSPSPSAEKQAPIVASTSSPNPSPVPAHLPDTQTASVGTPAGNAPVTPNPAPVNHAVQVASVQQSQLSDLQHLVGAKWRWSEIHASSAKPVRLQSPQSGIASIVGSAID